jgi:hypothetical protein
MKTLNTLIAIVVLTIVSNTTFGQNAYYNAKNILESDVATHKCANTEVTATSLKVCPMQLAEGVVVLKFANQPEGSYTVQVADENGTVLMTKAINHTSTSASETVKFGKTLAGGTYTVNVVKPDNTTKSETVMLLM